MSRVPISNLKPLKKRKLGTDSLHKHFGSIALPTLPPTLGRKRFPLPNQFGSEFCTAFGESVSSMFKYMRSFSAEWQTAMEGRYYGSPITNGADAAGSMDAAILNGSAPREDVSIIYSGLNDIQVADWNNYPNLQQKASIFPPGIPYKVDGPYDVFDNIRSALYTSPDCSVVKVFGNWYESFNIQAADRTFKGIVSKPNDPPVSLHRYNFVDWVITDQAYLVAALTQGADFGDGGYLYMNRDCVNFLFENMAEQGLGLYISRPASFNWPTTIAFFRVILASLLNRAAIPS